MQKENISESQGHLSARGKWEKVQEFDGKGLWQHLQYVRMFLKRRKEKRDKMREGEKRESEGEWVREWEKEKIERVTEWLSKRGKRSEWEWEMVSEREK